MAGLTAHLGSQTPDKKETAGNNHAFCVLYGDAYPNG
jgi:hypothetical protein